MVLIEALLQFVIDNAQLLAEAEAYERGIEAKFASPPYVWRRIALRTLNPEGRQRARPSRVLTAELLADLVLFRDELGSHPPGT